MYGQPSHNTREENSSTSNELQEVRSIMKQRHEKKKEEESIQKLRSFLERIKSFDKQLETFKQSFYEIYSKSFIEQVEKLKKELDLLKAEGLCLIEDRIIYKDILPSTFSECGGLLDGLMHNYSKLSRHCYENFVVPLIDKFWNFKYKFENYFLQVEKFGFQEKHPPTSFIASNSGQDENDDSSKSTRPCSINPSRERMPQHLLLQKFKSKAEMHVPSLNQALRGAAAFGIPEDLDDLLSYGANINSSDDNKKLTALHNAVMQKNIDNVYYLLDQRADIKLADSVGRTAASYAEESGNKLLIKLFSRTEHSALQITDLLVYILSFLPTYDIYRFKCISSFWKDNIRKLIEHNLNKIGVINAIQQFDGLPVYLQYIISKWLIEKNAVDQIKRMFLALRLSYDDRVDNVFPKEQSLKQFKNPQIGYVFSSRPITPQGGLIVSDVGITLYLLGLLTHNSLVCHHLLCTEYGALMMAEGLLTEEEIPLFSPTRAGATANLGDMLCKNGFMALRDKLLTLEQVANVRNLKALLSGFGLQALREGLITAEQAKKIYHSGSISGPHDHLKSLMSKNGLIALRKKFITPEQAAYINNIQGFLKDEIFSLFDEGLLSFSDPHYSEENIRSAINILDNLSTICSLGGIATLREGLLTQEQLEKIKSPAPLFTDNGLAALRSGLITGEQSTKIHDLKALLSDQGIKALKEGIITIEQAQKYNHLTILTLPNSIQALKERLITYEHVALFRSGSRSMTSLLSDKGLPALREGLITPEQAAKFYHSGSSHGPCDNLSDLLTPLGLIALREKFITPEQACYINCLNLLFKNNNKNVLVALRLHLINLDDFKYDGKFYKFPNNFDDELQKTISVFNEQQSEDGKLTKACLTVQRHWRGYLGRRKFGLFKDLQTCMRTGNIHHIDDMQNVKKLIDQNNIKDASAQVTLLRSKLM